MSKFTFIKQVSAGIASLVGFSSLALAMPSHAATLNGSFESGLNNWETAGDVSTQTESFGEMPTDGDSQALLTTASNTYQDDFPELAGALNFSGNEPSLVGWGDILEDFVGLPVGSLDPGFWDYATEGSAIKQTLNVNAGDILSFDWNLLSSDSFGQDYAFAVLDDTLLHLSDASGATSASNTPFSNQTGLNTFSHTFTSSGTHTLALGVVDVTDYNGTSALLVDNVQVESVPESSGAMGLLALGSLGIGVMLKQKQQKEV